MDRRLIIKTLELLEKDYPRPLTAEILMKKTRLKDIDGEFSQMIKYLRETNKIIVVFPENKAGLPTGRAELDKWLMKIDELTITPIGIDYLTEIKRIETDKKRNELISDTTIVLTQIAILGIVFTIYEKWDLSTALKDVEIPFLFSVIFWIVMIPFSLLLMYKVLNIVFSKESWKGVFFVRD